MTAHGNAVNSVNAKSSAKKGLQFSQQDLEYLHWNQGMSLTDIGKRYGVTPQAIRYWMQKFGIEHRSTKQTVFFESSPALSYVIGVLHGDGFLYANPANQQHHIILSVVDRPFADAFIRALNCLGLRAPIIATPARNENSQPQWRVYASSKDFYELWGKLSLDERLDLGMEYPADFLRGVYDSEGSVKWHRTSLELAIYSTNVAMQHRIMTVLEERGFAPAWHERRLESGKLFVQVQLFRSLEIKRFMAWVMPTIKIVPRGDANTEPSQDGDILEGVETTNADQTGQQVGPS
jgi:intein-encoded DNA endonuclease-like protein